MRGGRVLEFSLNCIAKSKYERDFASMKAMVGVAGPELALGPASHDSASTRSDNIPDDPWTHEWRPRIIAMPGR